MIAFTFDDGPNPNNTPKLLDGLKELDIKATFMVLGENASYYHSKGSEKITNDGVTNVLNFDLEYYIDEKQEYIKVNRWDYTGDYKDVDWDITDDGLGIWFGAPEGEEVEDGFDREIKQL